MKIGTVTFSESRENYGQILQCFALVKYLCNMGHEAFLIRVKHTEIDNRSFIRRVIDKFKILFSKDCLNVIKEVLEQKRQHKNMSSSVENHDRHFENFVRQYIPSTSKWYDDFSIESTPPAADAYVCGSDQIWGGDLKYMYLQFADANKIKISYAASFGGYNPDSSIRAVIKNYLTDFDWITLRETSGMEICKELGYTGAEVVPDPTLLLDVEEYEALANSSRPTNKPCNPYLFLYLLGNPISLNVSEIMAFARSKGLEVVYVTAHGRIDEYEKTYPSIEEWLSLIKDAECMITNSYHGTVFALQFNKKVLTLPVVGVRARMNTRIEELLSRYHFEDRIYNGNLDIVMKDMEYDYFNQQKQIDINRVSLSFEKILKKV